MDIRINISSLVVFALINNSAFMATMKTRKAGNAFIRKFNLSTLERNVVAWANCGALAALYALVRDREPLAHLVPVALVF